MNQTKVIKTLPIDDRFAFLRHCAKLYETNGKSPISDAEYDSEYYDLEKLDPNNAFFDEVGGMSSEHVYGTAVKHQVTMGSLNKSLSPEEFKDWLIATYGKETGLSFLLQHKVDGLSLSLHYDNGKLTQALTRGDGVTGIDVTANAVYVFNVLETISCKESIEVRGECFKNRQDFYKKWHTSVGGEYANPRNFTSGSINQKDAKVTKERGLSFVAYEVVRKDFSSEVDKDIFLTKQGFKTLSGCSKLTKMGNSLEQIAMAVKVYMDSIDRANLPYDIDGIVVKLNDSKKARSMGATSGGRKPKAHRAVKFPPAEAETILLGVEDNVGRIGTIAPVALLKPVNLDGAMISRASLHNYGMIRDSKELKIGSVVVVAKKGDIIPQIIRVKKVGDKDIPIPTKCPSCGEPLSWDANKVNLVCTNPDCVAQLASKIEHWFDKLGVKGIGEGMIRRLTSKDELAWEGQPIINSISDMYYKLDNDRQTAHPFRKYNYLKEQMGEKTYTNLLENVKSVDEVTLSKFIEALGIGKIGTMAKDITDIAPSIQDIDNLVVDDILKIDGFGAIKAKNFVDGWKAQRDQIAILLKYIKIVQPKFASQKLAGKKFCFTGSFSSPTRGEMEAMVPANGGKISSVSKELTALVWDGSMMGGKYDKANKLGVPVISQDDFMKMIA